MTTNIEEVFEFLTIAANQGFINDATAGNRRTACRKFVDILDEDQKNVEYLQDNLEVIKARFGMLNREVRGATVEEYKRRVQIVLNDFTAWKADRATWERDIVARASARPANDGEKKPRASKAEKSKPAGENGGDKSEEKVNPDARIVKFPLRPDFEISITLPREGLTVQELKKIGFFLLPYVPEWEPSDSTRTVFGALERNGEAVQ